MTSRGRGGGLPPPFREPHRGRGRGGNDEDARRRRIDECMSAWKGKEKMVELAKKRPREDSDEEVVRVNLPLGGVEVRSGGPVPEMPVPPGSGAATVQQTEELDLGGSAVGCLPVGEWKVVSWNVSGLSVPRLEKITGLGGDLWALQETHLPEIELAQRKKNAARFNWRLVHGKPAPVSTSGAGGRARGVGSLVAPGVAVREVMPPGRAWKKLWEAQRVHMVEFPPRAGLPRGLRVVNVYAPITEWSGEREDMERVWFQEMLVEVVAGLDLSIPTMFVGDWNGTMRPERDYGGEGSEARVCPMLVRLLGPGGPLVDLVDVFPDSWDWTFRGGGTSRCDAVLVSRSVLPLVAGFSVLTGVQDGGHSPLVVKLRPKALRMEWKAPRPQMPEVMHAPAKELQEDEAFVKVVAEWKKTEEFGLLKRAEGGGLGVAVFGALEKLVSLAGGREARTKKPRQAFDSQKVRRLRQDVNALIATEVELERWGRRMSVGEAPFFFSPIPFEVEERLKRLAASGMKIQGGGRETLFQEVKKVKAEKSELLKKEMQRMRWQRTKRWKEALPRVWQKSPGAVYSWLRDEKTSWGQAPLMDGEGQQLTDVGSVDAAVKDFWVEKVWRKENPDEAEASWGAFERSEFASFVPNIGSEWPEPKWTGALVKEVLRSMKQKAAPGMVGVPIGVWLALPSEWHVL